MAGTFSLSEPTIDHLQALVDYIYAHGALRYGDFWAEVSPSPHHSWYSCMSPSTKPCASIFLMYISVYM